MRFFFSSLLFPSLLFFSFFFPFYFFKKRDSVTVQSLHRREMGWRKTSLYMLFKCLKSCLSHNFKWCEVRSIFFMLNFPSSYMHMHVHMCIHTLQLRPAVGDWPFSIPIESEIRNVWPLYIFYLSCLKQDFTALFLFLKIHVGGEWDKIS